MKTEFPRKLVRSRSVTVALKGVACADETLEGKMRVTCAANPIQPAGVRGRQLRSSVVVLAKEPAGVAVLASAALNSGKQTRGSRHATAVRCVAGACAVEGPARLRVWVGKAVALTAESTATFQLAAGRRR